MQDLQGYSTRTNNDELQAELERMQDVLLLLDNLSQREEATVKAILDCLYEVGSVRLINQKVTVKVLRGPLKGIARFTKPVFRLFAWRWFQKNCPRLITNWLFDQVSFTDSQWLAGHQDQSVLIDAAPVQEVLPPLVEKQAAEILALRGRVGRLTLVVLLLALVVGWNFLY